MAVEFFLVFVYISGMTLKNNLTRNSTDKQSEYDSAWKDLIEELFGHFLEFFFPDIYRDIDFEKPVEFLDKESRPETPEDAVGKRLADVLARVHLIDGSVKCICIFIHIEVEGTPRAGFMERMYIYNYRSYDKNKKDGVNTEVISLAILTDEDVNHRPDEYRVSRWGYDLRMKIPIVKTIDYKVDETKRNQLETSTNPMRMIVKAQLKSQETKKGGIDHKYNAKWELIRECYRQGYVKDQIRPLLKFIDWVIRLPDELQKKIKQETLKIEEEYKMPYVPTWEREALQEGLQKGRQEGLIEGEEIGRKEGKQVGKQEEKLEVARRMLKGGMPVEDVIKFTKLPAKEVKKLASTTH